MTLVAGNVYVVFCNYIKPPHDKIAVCVCAKSGFFFWFNSSERPHGIAQLPVAATEHPALSRDCYLDLSSVKVFLPTDVPATADRGAMSPTLKAKVVAALSAPNKLLPEVHRSLALANLT